MAGGEVHAGEHVLLSAVHHGGALRHLGAGLVGDCAPLGVRGRCIFLSVGGADPGRDDPPLGLARVRESVACEVDVAALPGGPQRFGQRRLQALLGVGDDELHAGRAAPLQGAQEVQPEGFRLRTADRHAEHLAPAIGVDVHRDGDGDGDDAPRLADFHRGRVEPEIGPVTLDRPGEEVAHALVDLRTQVRDLAAADPLHPYGADQVVHRAGRDALDAGFLNHRR